MIYIGRFVVATSFFLILKICSRMQNAQEVLSGLASIASWRRGFLAGSSSSELFSFMASACHGCMIHSTTALSWHGL